MRAGCCPPRLVLLQPKTQDLVILGSCHFLIRPIFDPPDFQGGDERPSTMRRSNAMPLGRGAALNDGSNQAEIGGLSRSEQPLEGSILSWQTPIVVMRTRSHGYFAVRRLSRTDSSTSTH